MLVFFAAAAKKPKKKTAKRQALTVRAAPATLPEKGERGKTRVRRPGYTGWDSGASLLPLGENQRDGRAMLPG